MTLYLSLLALEPHARAVRRDLADCHALHRTVMSAFPDIPANAAGGGGDARARLGVLHRLEIHPRTGAPSLLVQSAAAPEWSALLDAGYLAPGAHPAVKPVAHLYDALTAGTALRFRLRANPTRRLSTPAGPDGARPPGKRVDLRDEAAQLAWLARKGEQGGFRLLDARAHPGLPNVRADPVPAPPGRRPVADRPAHRLTFGAVLFEGALAVTDPSTFRRVLAEGIGSAKAYGFGLLSIAPLGGAG